MLKLLYFTFYSSRKQKNLKTVSLCSWHSIKISPIVLVCSYTNFFDCLVGVYVSVVVHRVAADCGTHVLHELLKLLPFRVVVLFHFLESAVGYFFDKQDTCKSNRRLDPTDFQSQ